MSKLEKLITELCPGGVIFSNLSEVLTIRNGKDYKGFAEGDIPVYGSGGIMTYIDTAAYEKASVLIPRKGSLDKLYYVDVPFWTVDTIFYTEIDETKALPRYVFYYLQFQHLERLNKAGGVPSLTQAELNRVKIPLPPLPVQQEIVRILDSFTERTDELNKTLEAELTARRKQYEYYRITLFEKLIQNGVPQRKIGEFCNLVTGFPFDSAKFVSSGIRLLRGMNIKRGILDFSEENNKYWKNVDGLEKYILQDDDIVIAMDGSLVGKSFGILAEADLPLLLVQRVTRIRVQDGNPHFIYHYIASGAFTNYVDLKKTAGAVPHISLKDISAFSIPCPDINVQNEIATILDRFDALCNDLTSGLPAEIEARQKQYEYYRDKLLKFKSLSRNS